MTLRQTFAKNVRHWRHVRGMSQETLAYEASISRSYLYELERGKYPANVDFIERIAKVLAIEPSQLLDRSSKARGPRP
jgi:transcriptional regulator with XRE-family HTH domain